MSRLISDILAAPEPAFSHRIQNWEHLSGKPGIDIRLAADITHSLKKVIKSLDLDIDDTTGQELYYALLRRSLHDNNTLTEYLKISETDSPADVVKKIIDLVQSVQKNREIWSIKSAYIKKLLKDVPPKKLMKACGIRSIDSALRLRAPEELLALALEVEKPQWIQKFRSQYKNLQANDFDNKKAKVVIVRHSQVEKIQKSGYEIKQTVTVLPELGALVIVLPKERFGWDVSLITFALLEGMRNLRMHSAYFRLLSVRPKFGLNVYQALDTGLAKASQGMLDVGWSAVHALAGQKKHVQVLDNFQPHLSREDLLAPTATTLLSEILPSFSFWDAYGFVAKTDSDGPVSCHFFDIVINASNNLPYESRSNIYVRGQLWDELCARYMSEDSIAEVVLFKGTQS